MRYWKSGVTGAGLETSSDPARVVGTDCAASLWSKSTGFMSTGFMSTGFMSTDFASMGASPMSAVAINDGPETAAGTESCSAASAVPGPRDASGTAAKSAGAAGVSALMAASGIASGTVALDVFSPT